MDLTGENAAGDTATWPGTPGKNFTASMEGPYKVPNGSTGPSSDLFWRQFHRGNMPNEDILADAAYLDRHFIDPFGILLRKVDLAQFQTFDKVLLWFMQHDTKYNLKIFCVAEGGTHASACNMPRTCSLTA